jgi:hypothetical protein
MTYHALLEYIRNAKKCGASDVDISDRLHKAGWYRVDVEDAMALYNRLTSQSQNDCAPTPPPKPSLGERVVPRHYDPYLVPVAAVSFAIGFIGYLLLTR